MKTIKNAITALTLFAALVVAPLSQAAPEKPFNVNTASVAQLDELIGVGPKKAKAIKEYIAANGEFKTVEALSEVSGIGPKTVEKNRKFLLIK